MALPAFQAIGTVQANVGAVTVGWPTHVAGDIGLLLVETANEAVTLSTPAGFVEVPGSPVGTGTGGAAGATRITVFWCRATSNAMTSPIVADSGNHNYARIITYRGCIATGNPWDFSSAANTGTIPPSLSCDLFPSSPVTNNEVNICVVAIIANDQDSNTDQLNSLGTSIWNIATHYTTRGSGNSNIGNGGGISVGDTNALSIRSAQSGGTSNFVNSSLFIASGIVFAGLVLALKGINEYDEDFWKNPVAPTPSTNYQRLPVLFDPEDTPALTTPTLVEEDFWQNPVAPVAPSLYQRLPILPDPEEIPAATLYGEPDEDFDDRLLMRPPAVVNFVASALMVLSVGAGNEDFVPPPAGDELALITAVAPIQATLYQRLPLGDPEEIPAGSLTGQPDEDFAWWQLLGPPRPVQATFYQQLPYLPDPEEVPAGELFGQDDEDFWVSGVVSVPATFYQQLPLGDPEEIPAGSLTGQPDEDFWVSGVAPVPTTLRVQLPLGDPEELPALFVPDEDFWTNSVAPVAPPRVQFLLGGSDDLPAVAFSDEDVWQNRVAVVSAIYQRLPLGDPENNPTVPVPPPVPPSPVPSLYRSVGGGGGDTPLWDTTPQETTLVAIYVHALEMGILILADHANVTCSVPRIEISTKIEVVNVKTTVGDPDA